MSFTYRDSILEDFYLKLRHFFLITPGQIDHLLHIDATNFIYQSGTRYISNLPRVIFKKNFFKNIKVLNYNFRNF